MELNWTTFLLEIINFLVLVWILKHFLYRPVLGAIERRRAGIEQQASAASEQREQAESMRTEYEGRLAELDRERERARAELDRELEQLRSDRIKALDEELEQRREAALNRDRRALEEQARAVERQAMLQAGGFASRLVSLSAGPDLESRLVAAAAEGLRGLTGEQREAIRSQCAGSAGAIEVVTAFPLPDQGRDSLERALAEVVGREPRVSYRQEPGLLAGAQISVGAWELQANLRQELAGFLQFAHSDE